MKEKKKKNIWPLAQEEDKLVYPPWYQLCIYLKQTKKDPINP